MRRRLMYTLVGAMAISAVLAGCGKTPDSVSVNENSEQTTLEQDKENTTEGQTGQSDDLLDSQVNVFNGYTAKIPKGYKKTGNTGEVVFNQKDKTDLYISSKMDSKNTLALSDVNSEALVNYISKDLWNDDSISKEINGYTKDVPLVISSVNDVEINGMKMKKFEGTLTLAKSSSDKDTIWDCYIYGYVFETKRSTIMFYGLEQEQSQPTDKIDLIKKNLDAMVKTIEIN
mgnify:CR=1 FL=1